jgi:choline kinase
MKGLVLAAGRGSRLRDLTDERPKCLVRLAGRPLLDWQRAALTTAGVTDLAIVTGYRAHMLADLGMKTFAARRWAESNMVRSLLAAAGWLSAEPCVVSYGDIVYRPATVRRLADAPGELVIAYDPQWIELWSRRFANPLDDAETFRLTADGAVREIGARPCTASEIEGQYMGLLRFTPAAWAITTDLLRTLPPRRVDELDMTSLLQALVDAGTRIEAVPCRDAWCEVDSADDLAVAEDLVARGQLVWNGE